MGLRILDCGLESAIRNRNPAKVTYDARSMSPFRLGTMGFGYDDWAGPFYPKGLRRDEWLTFYARHFNAVELDTTFHATPDVERVRRWAAAVPEDFRFCAKPRRRSRTSCRWTRPPRRCRNSSA